MCLYTHHIFLNQSSVDRHLGRFHVWAIVNSAAMNTGVHISFQISVFVFFWTFSQEWSGIAGSCGSSTFSFFCFCLFFGGWFWAALRLHCCAWAFSNCSKLGLLFVVVHRLLIVVASRCRAWASRHTSFSSCGSMRALEHRLSSCGTRAQLLHSMWDLPGPGLEPVSPALAGGFVTTAPPGKSLLLVF